MGQRERDRLKVLHEVEAGHLRQREAALQLGMSERGLRKLLRRYRSQGDRAVVHGLRGRKSNRRLERKTAVRAVRLVERHYGDFGPTLASECLRERHGIDLSRETLRQLLIEAGLWEANPRKEGSVHVWRPRRSCFGEMLQWDTSIHAWLEDRGPAKMYLIAAIDDATNTLFARFVASDSTEEHMRVLWAYVERYGRPQALYTDRASIFQPTLAQDRKGEEPGPKTETQMGRALRELGIEWIAAYSPQAKGRVERCFGTLQDRLVKGLRLAGVRTLEAANGYLEREFLPDWNQRFTRAPANDTDVHRPLAAELELAGCLAHVEYRQVANDYTVAWRGRKWRIPRHAIVAGLRGASIRVEQRLDGTLMAQVNGVAVELEHCDQSQVPEWRQPAVQNRYIPPPGQSRWMDRFKLKGTPTKWEAPRPQQTATVSAPLRSPSGLPPRG